MKLNFFNYSHNIAATVKIVIFNKDSFFSGDMWNPENLTWAVISELMFYKKNIIVTAWLN